MAPQVAVAVQNLVPEYQAAADGTPYLMAVQTQALPSLIITTPALRRCRLADSTGQPRRPPWRSSRLTSGRAGSAWSGWPRPPMPGSAGSRRTAPGCPCGSGTARPPRRAEGPRDYAAPFNASLWLKAGGFVAQTAYRPRPGNGGGRGVLCRRHQHGRVLPWRGSPSRRSGPGLRCIRRPYT